MNNWCFSCVLITINLGDVQLSICVLLIKKSFHYESQNWRMDTVRCCTWWQDQNCDDQAILLLCINSKVNGLIILGIIFEYSLYFYAFCFAVRLSRLVLTLCNLEQYEVDTISGDIVKTLHVIVGFSVKRNFVCESKFSWWLFQLVVVSRFA